MTAQDKAKAYQLCRDLYSDVCRCSTRGGGPCEVITDMIDTDHHVGLERQRMAEARREAEGEQHG